jgi:hypothetical protein
LWRAHGVTSVRSREGQAAAADLRETRRASRAAPAFAAAHPIGPPAHVAALAAIVLYLARRVMDVTINDDGSAGHASGTPPAIR